MSINLDESLLSAIAEITASYLGNTNHTLSSDAVPQFIRDVRSVLLEVAPSQNTASEEKAEEVVSPTPVVAISESITPDYLVCLEDGRKLKVLTSHLKKAYNLTPREYRIRWGLPGDYPMVAPNYSSRRAELARKSGFVRQSLLAQKAKSSPSVGTSKIVSKIATAPSAPSRKAPAPRRHSKNKAKTG